MRKSKSIMNRPVAAAAMTLALAGFASAEPRHGIAMYGDPALPQDFVSLPYANPDAPTGGRIVTGEVGGFDSLNPHIRKGRVPWQLRFLAYESLMARNWDEPFSLYGLLAESLETGTNREWAEFVLREEARFADGTPVTVEDVLWSYETLGTAGHPRYLAAWEKVKSAEITGPRSIRFTFHEPEPELALVIGMRPILKKAQWDGIDFAESGLDNIPIATAPYVISDFEAGRHVTLTRNPDYWGRHLPVCRGIHNLDEIRLEFFTDADVMFEAFKAGEINTIRETNRVKWDTLYDFPAIRSGNVVKSEIPHQRPSGIRGLVMNTRKPVFDDWRVRDAMIHAFNHEFINRTLAGGAAPRITSYFSNSILSMREGAAEGSVRSLLEPFADELPPGVLEGYTLPAGDVSERNQRDLRKALMRLEDAGWKLEDGVMRDGAGEPLLFEILVQSGSAEVQSIVDIYVEALKRVGIVPTVTAVDSAQFKERTQRFDFDMTFYTRGLSLSPGNEQLLYWGSAAADQPGSRNWMGVRSAAIDAAIDSLLNAGSREDFVAAARALDRVLTAGRYVIPIWHNPTSRIAHARGLRYPDTLPIYGDWLGFQPDVWWWEE